MHMFKTIVKDGRYAGIFNEDPQQCLFGRSLLIPTTQVNIFVPVSYARNLQ